jgi:hypothetical protein
MCSSSSVERADIDMVGDAAGCVLLMEVVVKRLWL